jgi:hypothetical protein
MVLCQQEYLQQGGRDGLLRRYCEKMTGRSRTHVTQLIARYQVSGAVQPIAYRRHRFAQRYTWVDLELLAAVNEAQDTLSGPPTRRILEREYQQYWKPEYEGEQLISVTHLYNLRRHQRYRETSSDLSQDQGTTVSIREQRRPDAPMPKVDLGIILCARAIRTWTKGIHPITGSVKRPRGRSRQRPSAQVRAYQQPVRQGLPLVSFPDSRLG